MQPINIKKLLVPHFKDRIHKFIKAQRHCMILRLFFLGHSTPKSYDKVAIVRELGTPAVSSIKFYLCEMYFRSNEHSCSTTTK